MGIVLTGIGQQLTNAHPVSSSDPDFQNIANLKVIGPVPILVLVMIAVVARHVLGPAEHVVRQERVRSRRRL